MDTNRYVKLIEQIIKCKRVSDDDKKRYLRLLKLIENLNTEQLNDYEQMLYMINGRKLTDKERILYELSFLNLDPEMELLVKKYAYRLKHNSNNKTNIDKLKKSITKLQMKNNIKPSFYSVFESLIDDETKETVDEAVLRKVEGIKKTR